MRANALRTTLGWIAILGILCIFIAYSNSPDNQIAEGTVSQLVGYIFIVMVFLAPVSMIVNMRTNLITLSMGILMLILAIAKLPSGTLVSDNPFLWLPELGWPVIYLFDALMYWVSPTYRGRLKSR